MRDELKQQMRHAFEQLDEAAPPHDLPTSAQVWLRLQFRLVRRPRRNNPQAGILLAALYVFSFLIKRDWSEWFSATLIAILASAVFAATLLLVQVSRKFR